MRRDKIEIFADILKVAKNGAKKTHIVYKANLNFSTLKNHIKRL
ncbi:MAG: winged helix-turn-helix domain-containing protein, partial [Candidatus Bathyarchaeota archaeon]|nr:winged helix-turn-helix domain-containing protein [Candidatus Bathyarchaeota archaeon]